MSRSCHSATFSSAGVTALRTTRARPVRFSVSTGLRLCGMAEEPFCPGEKYSSASSTSVRCRWRTSIDRRSMLLALTQAGLERDASYRLVQRNAMKVWESDGQLSLLELLKADPEVAAALTPRELEERFNLDYHFKAVDVIFERVFGA